MRGKKELRKKENRKGVYIEEDLTPLRSRIVRSLRGEHNIKAVWTIDGKIFVINQKNGREEKIAIEKAEDLKKVGWTAERIQNIYRK